MYVKPCVYVCTFLVTTKSFPVPVQGTLKVAPSYLVCYQNPVGNWTQEQCYNKDNLCKNLIKEKNSKTSAPPNYQ